MSSPTTYFWYRETLNISPSVDERGSLNWWVVVSLLAAWIIVFLCMVKGIASSGKFTRLGDPQVWLEAATQIFFSLGVAFGGLIAFSSYMPVRNNCYRDAILVSVINCGTSVFAGVVIFSILGITFIAFTEAINQLPAAPVWSVLFFLMLLTLGLDSMFGMLEGVVTSIIDMNLIKNLFCVAAVLCLVSLLLSFCFADSAGPYIFVLFDEYSGNIPLLIIALGELLGLT